MSIQGFSKVNHLSELAEPLDTQEGVLSPATRRARTMGNLMGGSASDYVIVEPSVRATVANAATISAVQMRSGILFQDASGGNVTMTTRTGTQLAADFPEIGIGQSILIHHASNHATNTSTVSGGTDVTLVGSGAVTQTGGSFRLVKLTATTFEYVRVG